MKNKGIKNILSGSPQRKGIIIKLLTLKPKKPNSALRKVAKVKIDNKIIRAYIPGEGHNLNIYNQVLIRKGRVPDLPGINFKIIRGTLDSTPVIRISSRSKYGCKKNIK